jgi:hypothetical protein
MNVKIGGKDHHAQIKGKKNEFIITVDTFPFDDVYGLSIENAKSNFKLQVKEKLKLEVVWVE